MELTQEELITLEIFTADAGAFQSVRKVALEYVERQKDVFIRNLKLNKGLSNSEIGEKIRGFDEATFLVEGVFREVGLYRKGKPPEEGKNSAY